MVLAVALSLPLAIGAQTVSSGNFQVLGSFDVSTGTWSKPMVAVTSDPSGACSTAASMVVNTSIGPQQGDISVCLNGAWTLAHSGSSGAGQFAQFAPTYSGGGVTFGSCATGAPCYLAPNNQLDTYTSTPTVTPGTGTAADTLYIYGVPGSNTIQVGESSANTYGCAGCQVNSGISAPPNNSYPIYRCTVAGGQVVSGGCTPLSTPYANIGFENGLGTQPRIDATTGALQINNNRNPRVVTSSSDVITNFDCGGIVIYSNTSTVNVALPQAGTGNPVTFASGCDIWIVNIGNGAVQITPNANSPINGSTSAQTLSSGAGAYLVSTGAKYNAAFTGAGGGVSSLQTSGGTITGQLIVSSAATASSAQIEVQPPASGGFAGIGITGSGQPGFLIDNANSTGNLNFYDRSTNLTDVSIAKSTGVLNVTQGIFQLGTQITPSTSSSTCTTGYIEADANYIYVCTAANTWKRLALSSF